MAEEAFLDVLVDGGIESESDLTHIYTPSDHTDSASSAPNNEPLCEDCMLEPPVWYCEVCLATCQACWDSRNAHKRHDENHKRVPFENHLLFKNVLTKKLSKKAEKELHARDQATLWFAVDAPQGGSLSLEEFPRFNQVIGEHREQFGYKSACYPRLVSFIGDTGVGKSSIIRFLIEHPWDSEARRHARTSSTNFTVPVVGRPQSTNPTSGDVHLYRDELLDAAEISSPVFYADCEGFGGGKSEPQARQVHQNFIRSFARHAVDEISRWAKMGYGRIFQGFQRQIRAVQERDAAVKEMFPRLLYSFSDVIVHVILSTASRKMENHITKLLEWSHASHSAAVNRLMLPHLIIVLNQSDKESEWDPVKTKSIILAEQARILDENETVKKLRAKLQNSGAQINSLEDLLNESYSSVQFIRLPHGVDCSRFSEQLRLFHGMIRDCSKSSQSQKMKMNMSLSSRSLDHFFKLAFDHYSESLNQPFDFLEAIFSTRPLPVSFSDNISYMMRQAFHASEKEITEDIRASSFSEALAPTICSAIALDIVRSYEVMPGTFDDIFNGKISRSSGLLRLSEKSYQMQVDKAFAQFEQESMQCQFHNYGEQCVNKYSAHIKLHRHQDRSGSVIGHGPFQSSLQGEVMKCWANSMELELIQLRQMPIFSPPESTSHHQAPREESAIWKRHQSNITNLFSTLDELWFRNAYICFWCIQNTVAEILPCGHGVCERCLVAMGSINHSVDSRVVNVESCNLHPKPYAFQEPARFLLLPNNIGRRVLTMDGGGVRGLVGLRILARIEHRMGGKIPISNFFDLIGGTSAGGLVALGLALKDWKVKDALQAFVRLSAKAFTFLGPRIPLRIFFTFFEQYASAALYSASSMEMAIHEAFDALAQRELLGLKGDESRELSSKVFVTATVDAGEKGAVIANYVRYGTQAVTSGSDEGQVKGEYEFEAGTNGRDFKVWEAARATSAAPFYFPALRHKNRFEFWDGALFYNNPAKVAMCETEHIWPSTKGKLPDILLSVGNGYLETGMVKLATEAGRRVGASRPFTSGYTSFMRTLLVLKNRLLTNIDSEAMWSGNFAHLSTDHPKRYIRLNPKVSSSLPNLDDVRALYKGGTLERISEEYLDKSDTQKCLDNVFSTLVSTSFYFHFLNGYYHDASGTLNIKGNIMCRFTYHSDTMKNFGKLIRSLECPRFELGQASCRKWILDYDAISKMENPGVLSIPIAFEIPDYRTKVDIRFVADDKVNGSISSFPTSLGDYIEALHPRPTG